VTVADTISHADRDEIKARAEADFLNFYLEHGGRRRAKALHCIFHSDRNPSASIHKSRHRCPNLQVLGAAGFTVSPPPGAHPAALAFSSQ
jgi:hypothetical protein